jgi:hypothetical protein
MILVNQNGLTQTCMDIHFGCLVARLFDGLVACSVA